MNDCLPIGTIPNHVHRYTLVYGWHLWWWSLVFQFRIPRSERLRGGNEHDITKTQTT